MPTHDIIDNRPGAVVAQTPQPRDPAIGDSGTPDTMSKNTKLELTWIGKESRR
jgi:hypothetical protein